MNKNLTVVRTKTPKEDQEFGCCIDRTFYEDKTKLANTDFIWIRQSQQQSVYNPARTSG